MIFKILAVVSVVNMCACHKPVEPIKPHHPENLAVSSQSYVRHDVPLSYKFSAVHVYTTKGPHYQKHGPIKPSYHSPENNKRPTAIQYAPILRDNDIQNAINNNPSYNARSNQIKENTKLEPKLLSPSQQLAYVPGYNVEMFQSVYRYPGHNAVYRSYPNMDPQEKPTKMNYMNQFHTYEQPDPARPIFVATQPPSLPIPTIFDFIPKQYTTTLDSASNITDQPTEANEISTPYPIPAVRLSPIDAQKMYPQHPMKHRMLLNVARTYNIAKLPLKAHSKYAKPIKARHTQMQTLFKNANTQTESEGKTYLHPVFPFQPQRRLNYIETI